MAALEALWSRRSVRRFTRQPVPHDALAAMAEAARLSPTMLNRQPLRFAVISNHTLCARVFPYTHWAKLLPGSGAGPDESTQPAAYIAILVDRRIAQESDVDAGAAGMSILLAAEAQGIASCWLGSIDREEILALLGISSDRFSLHTLVALGYALSKPRAVPLEGENTAYYLEAPNSLCVPKRLANQVICWIDDEGGSVWNET